MKKSLLAAAVLLVAATGTASAGGSEGSIGVGAEFMRGLDLTFGMSTLALDVGGASVNYDAGKFHVGGFLGVRDYGGNDDTFISIGGRFYYHVHSTAMSDFGIGATMGILTNDDGNDRTNIVFLDPGMQLRVFVASNVALSLSAGLSVITGDGDGFALGGQATGSAGMHYYFF